MKPFVKYPGGKSGELGIIFDCFPARVGNYFEPFLGGGAVFFASEFDGGCFLNDKSVELMDLYRLVQVQDAGFFEAARAIDACWVAFGGLVEDCFDDLLVLYDGYKCGGFGDDVLRERVRGFVFSRSEVFLSTLSESLRVDPGCFLSCLERSVFDKLRRMARFECSRGALPPKDFLKNFETGFRAGVYSYFRFLYNNSSRLGLGEGLFGAVFYFIREFCYSSMFRYSKSGVFNVPYGGASYNGKSLSGKIDYLSSGLMRDKLAGVGLFSLDFEEFFGLCRPGVGDFVFLDPPYDTVFSSYANNCFDRSDHVRLAEFCRGCEANFMLVVKNTDFVRGLYEGFNVVPFGKKYSVSFMNRNVRDVEHLLITNYGF